MKCENCKKYLDCREGSGLTWPCGAYVPCIATNDDAISREAIIDALHEIGGCDAEPETWSAGWDAAINAAIELAEKAPAVTNGERHEH